VWDAFENIYKNNFMSGTSYRSITAAQLLKDIRSNSHRTFEYYEIQDELEIVDIPLNYLSFKNCTFNEVVFISGNLGSGAVLNSCIIKKTITFRSIKAKFKRRGQIGLRSSLSIEKSEVKTLEIYDSELERGIQIINDSHIDNLIISGLKTSANSALKINDSTISSQFELTFFRTNGNIDIRTSEISCFARFEDIMASSFLLQQNKFKRLFVWGSSFSQGLSIDKTEFSDTLEFLGTSCDKFFGLYNSTFMKEFTVKNYDSNNSLTSHISHYFIQNSNFESGFHALNFKPDLHPDLTLYFSNSLKGNVIFEREGKKIPDENIWPLVSFAAPYTELIENLTLTELIDFHFHFKKTIIGIEKRDIINLLDLDMHKDKFIKTFSSGMKQRVKLGLAIFTDTPILLLDEPTSNFDKNACNWYHQLIEKYIGHRLLIIGSNNEEEYHFCNHKLCISDYKLG
jgi:ABC-type transport system involved in cytochrome c biogenesis ATPase subunit